MTQTWLLFTYEVSLISCALVAGVFPTFSDFVMRSLNRARTSATVEVMQGINREVFKTVFMVLLIGMWGAILFVPDEFHASSGIVIGSDENLLSEVRAAGGALLACAMIVLLGAFISRLTFTALLLSTVLYLSYGVSRLVSMAVDGLPSLNLMAVTLFELGIGLVCALALATGKSSASPDGKAVA